jgi:hypothetical protein
MSNHNVDLGQLQSLIDSLRSSIVDVFVLVQNSESFKTINANSKDLKEKARRILIDSSLSQIINEEIDLWQAKNLKTCCLILNKIIEIEKLSGESFIKYNQNIKGDNIFNLVENYKKYCEMHHGVRTQQFYNSSIIHLKSKQV